MQNSIALGNLTDWLDTWKARCGGYNGPVIHRFRNKRMFRIHDTAWTQASMIRGFVNAYERGGQEEWRRRLEAAADRQYELLDPSSGKFRFAGHEDDRFCSLVHCALADIALLAAAKFVDSDRAHRYRMAAKTNLERYCLASLWVESEGAFKFAAVDHWSPHEDRFVVNFNTVAAEALLACADATGDDRLRVPALRIGDWIVNHCERARVDHPQLLGGHATVVTDPTSEWMSPGGLSYQYTRTQNKAENCVLIYAGLALRGLCALYRATHDPRLATVIRETVEYVLAMRDPSTRLFFHTTSAGRIIRYPQFVAGAGMVLTGLDAARKTLSVTWDWADTTSAILSHQYPNGSFPGFIGKDHPVSNCQVWEDLVATPNWNAQLFEYLTIVAQPTQPSVRPLAHLERQQGVLVYDSRRALVVVSWRPWRFNLLYLAVKRWPLALLYLEPHEVVARAVDQVLRVLRGAFRLPWRTWRGE